MSPDPEGTTSVLVAMLIIRNLLLSEWDPQVIGAIAKTYVLFLLSEHGKS